MELFPPSTAPQTAEKGESKMGKGDEKLKMYVEIRKKKSSLEFKFVLETCYCIKWGMTGNCLISI